MTTLAPSYHDVEFEFEGQPRIKLFDAPFNVMITCTRVGGWELWEMRGAEGPNERILAGEYRKPSLRIWVAGNLVVDGDQNFNSGKKETI